ncbi:MAG TPA: hypothetical protein VKI44_33845 [Acetobacteraceae bacterium]|nr:hypothetical protein [Acetobacteraceae bacterium]
MNQIVGQSPANRDGEQFLARNLDAVEEAALELQYDEVLAQGASTYTPQ